MTEHTPWRVSHYRQIKDATGHIVAVCEDPVNPNARFIVTACNCHADLLEALKEIAKGEGAYSRDPLKHASNAVVNMRQIAREAIRKHEETL